jgi:hypothetical protein
MQMRLFGHGTKRIVPVLDSEMWALLRKLRATSLFDPFRIWLIGSRVQPDKCESDIDLILSLRAGFTLDDRTVERGLWYCRDYGLYSANPACVVDPCFRADGPTLAMAALQPHTVLKGIKLFSPKLMRRVLAGRIRDYRRLGEFSIEYCRRAEETGYYQKLPKGRFDGRLYPYLRPAIEVPFPAIQDHEV